MPCHIEYLSSFLMLGYSWVREAAQKPPRRKCHGSTSLQPCPQAPSPPPFTLHLHPSPSPSPFTFTSHLLHLHPCLSCVKVSPHGDSAFSASTADTLSLLFETFVDLKHTGWLDPCGPPVYVFNVHPGSNMYHNCFIHFLKLQ